MAMLLLLAVGLTLLFTLVLNKIKHKYALKQLINDPQQKTNNFADFLIGLTLVNSEQITKKFVRAGYYHFSYAHLYLPAKLIIIISAGVLVWLFGSDTMSIKFIVFMPILIAVIIIPDLYLEKRATALSEKISGNLSYLLDLMAICVQTGMTIESSMAYLSKEVADFNIDLSYMLQVTVRRAKITGMEIALDELNERVSSTEMRSFVNTLNQSLKFGTSIYPVLISLSQDIQELQMLNLEEKVGSLSAKMSVPLILFIMFPIIIIIVAPGIMRLMA
jgi:tight adherence protein C